MMKLLIVIYLILVYNQNAVSSLDPHLERTLNNLKAFCDIKPTNHFNMYSDTKKYPILGEGGFGKVYEITENKVLKIIRIERAANHTPMNLAYNVHNQLIELDTLKFFGDDARKYNNLFIDALYDSKDNNILKMYDCAFTTKGTGNDTTLVQIGITLEKLDMSLTAYLANNKNIPVPHLTEITRNMIRALYKMHQHGFAHLDLKGGNVMMRNPFQPVLIDFGLTQRLVKKTDNEPLTVEQIKETIRNTNRTAGTPFYFDPAAIDSQYRFTSDTYGLGAMIITFFSLNVNLKEYTIKNSFKMKEKLEVLVSPLTCTKYANTCIFKTTDSRFRYFKSLIFWLVRVQPINRIYLDLAMEKLIEIDNLYYKDCIIRHNGEKNQQCYRSKDEYRQYRADVMRKYDSSKKSTSEKAII